MHLAIFAQATDSAVGPWIACAIVVGGFVTFVFKINDRYASKADHDKLEKRLEIVESEQRSVNHEEQQRKSLSLMREVFEAIASKHDKP